MPDVQQLAIFHYDGSFEFDLNRPQYKGGRQKVRYLSSNISISELKNMALEASSWDVTVEDLNLKYLLHNGSFFSAINIDDDSDINGLFKTCMSKSSGALIFVTRFIGEEDSTVQLCQERFDRTGTSHPTNKIIKNMKSKVKGSTFTSPSKYCPTINIREDVDVNFSSFMNDVEDVVAKPLSHESNVVVVNIVTAEAQPMFEEFHDVCLNIASESTRTSACVCPEFKPIGRSTTECDTPLEGCNGSRCTAVDGSNTMHDSTFVDTMVPEAFIVEVIDSSFREMWLGREFPDREAFRKGIAKHAIYNNFTLKHLKTSMKMVTACCKDDNCSWRIHGSIVDSDPHFKVWKYRPIHSCSKPMMGTTHRQASTQLIAEFVEGKIRCNNDIRPKEIMNEYETEFGTKITYRKAHMAREIALRKIRGSYEESFQILPLYCFELQRTNIGTVTNIDITSDGRFRRFFWAFGPCIRSFQTSLRPLLAVDGSHLRGKYPGVFLLAVTHDANHQLFPIAFAFAEAERRDSWEWFLANLSNALGEPKNLTIVSDRQKGLIPALRCMLPSASHCFCCHHIAENIKASFNDHGIVRTFWKAARAYRPNEFNVYMSDIRSTNEHAFEYIGAIGRQYWATTYVHGWRYDMLTSNTAECTNSLLKDTRVLPITKQVEEIRAKLMDFYQKRRIQTQNITTRLTPYAEKHLNNEMEEACRLHVRVAGLVEFQVQSAEYMDVVDLEKKSCTCRKWEVIGLPCCHALASMQLRNINPYEYCEHWYSVSMYQRTYDDIIHATRDMKQWEQRSILQVHPPLAKKQPGRPKKNRIRVEEMNRQRRVVTCSNCRQRGHNRGSCKNPPASS